MTGRIVDIKRMAVHDGPGIRTTVFFKGCPLNCRWCHNPESVNSSPEIGYFPRICLNCGKCAEVCPQKAHEIIDDKHIYNRKRCTACGKCVEACPGEALEYYGREIGVEDAFAAVMEDKTFYEQSGGGCTVSGGEPLLQAGFCADLFKRLQEKEIHCAVDTSGAVPWNAFEAILPHADLFLYDLKHTDDAKHRKQVETSNRRTIDNLKRLSQCGIPIEIRIPLIPGFNANDKSMTAAGKLLSGLDNITGVNLLPYHYAHSKYGTVGHRDIMPEVEPPSPEQIAHVSNLLCRFGLNIK